MAEPPPPIQFEDVPLNEARRMSRGPRMDPELYHALKEKLPSLDDTATRLRVPEGTSVTTMKARILPHGRRAEHPCHGPARARRPALLALHGRGRPAGQRGRGPAADGATDREDRPATTGPPPRAPAKGDPVSVHTPTRMSLYCCREKVMIP
jgi:hypothetical protein